MADHDHLIPEFLKAMDDIGRYGAEKYGVDSFQFRRLTGDRSRGEMQRTQTQSIADHATIHFAMHIEGIPHDHFHTRRHQLAAVAFNAMMEFYFAGFDTESRKDGL